ncbi:hypothetical protein LOTGIDRAFT_157042 [Lottia gigantea]|uniref:RCC1-like domain-containing protein n=1 Tax=Lottia gigantea TaxID=225164 RepID=V4B6A9_LOTGI|nr:hypothetical protein LOTGIDRAFT_157042 [Lottia gigantea]ESP03081.1 hypothetical protein LOTGIDRAFT_157042 [Lottia gigantea]
MNTMSRITTVYLWGLGISGQLGSGEKKNSPIPRPIKYDDKPTSQVVQISCGGLFTTALSADGRVFTSGCGKNGRLGNGATTEQLKFQDVSNLGNTNKRIASGIWHGACINQQDNLCIWGHPKPCGKQDRTMAAVPPTIIDGIQISGVSCGFNYTLMWSLDGTAYSFGSGHFGVLGHGSVEDVPLPKIIEKLMGHKITTMCAGYNHSGAVTDEGKIYMWGKGSDGALGFGKDVHNQMEPKELIVRDVRFTVLSCSVGEHHGHTLASTANGFVYSWGDGYKGKLGHGDQCSIAEPRQINSHSFDNESIIDVCAGGIHSCALSKEGHVFTWGCGSDGRLGHPESIGHRYLYRSDVPKRVEDISKYKALGISCSYYHTAALVKK